MPDREFLSDSRVVVTGAGGFIGGWLVREMIAHGARTVRAVDVKPKEAWFQIQSSAENVVADLHAPDACARACDGMDHVFNLAADMGGIGFIEGNKAACMASVVINTNMLLAALKTKPARYFYSSSACIYPAARQHATDDAPLREDDAYPADPEDGYGWEKLFSERACRHFHEDHGLPVRIARLHNVYGPNGSYIGGREKAPAAICRKVIEAKLSGSREIEVWGDGEQTRSFLYVSDCVEGIFAIAQSDVPDPLNVGSAERVTVNHLIDIVEDLAGVKLTRRYVDAAPKGVRGRSSDNTKIRERLGWEPSIRLAQGMEKTYAWIYDQMKSAR